MACAIFLSAFFSLAATIVQETLQNTQMNFRFVNRGAKSFRRNYVFVHLAQVLEMLTFRTFVRD